MGNICGPIRVRKKDLTDWDTIAKLDFLGIMILEDNTEKEMIYHRDCNQYVDCIGCVKSRGYHLHKEIDWNKFKC